MRIVRISNCEELEQIIAKDNNDEKDQIFSGSDLQSSCFPNLCELEITGCNKLKSLFPIAMASGLKKLQELKDDHASPANLEKEMKLKVDECPKLTTIFGTTSNGSISAQSEEVISNLHASLI
ncbi:hypothetical protein NC651_004334 [Populus alba x Populus x berolinensis]|nr:hypothetical protein NC651_004334 [Populus alba x Populus x berolinensis]